MRAASLLAASAASLVAAAPYTVLVMGDWGGSSKAPYTTPEQLSTAAAMGQVGAALAPSQVWGVGDNVRGRACP